MAFIHCKNLPLLKPLLPIKFWSRSDWHVPFAEIQIVSQNSDAQNNTWWPNCKTWRKTNLVEFVLDGLLKWSCIYLVSCRYIYFNSFKFNDFFANIMKYRDRTIKFANNWFLNGKGVVVVRETLVIQIKWIDFFYLGQALIMYAYNQNYRKKIKSIFFCFNRPKKNLARF